MKQNIRETLDITYEISKLQHYYPMREGFFFEKLKAEMAPHLPSHTMDHKREFSEEFSANFLCFLKFWDVARE